MESAIEPLPPDLWMASLMDDGEDQDFLRVDQEVDDVGKASELSAADIFAYCAKLSGTIDDLLKESSCFDERSRS
jgi:hypothetical protein